MRLLRVVMISLALVLAGPSAAQATRLAGLKLVPADGAPGARVHVTGTWFAAAGDGFASVAPVEIRWGGTSGPVLERVRPDAGGTFITRITVPAGSEPGQRVVVATQSVADREGTRRPAPGTPAKAAFHVRTAADRGTLPPGITATTSVPGRDAAGIVLVLAGLLGLVAFSAAAWMLLRGRGHGPAATRLLRPSRVGGQRDGSSG